MVSFGMMWGYVAIILHLGSLIYARQVKNRTLPINHPKACGGYDLHKICVSHSVMAEHLYLSLT